MNHFNNSEEDNCVLKFFFGFCKFYYFMRYFVFFDMIKYYKPKCEQ
jgi:hypothetical protein